ncbi:MAG: hypothetical protein Q8N23_24460 [Archangium sp.]|nr:hypothetical protein [Archangium sp.]
MKELWGWLVAFFFTQLFEMPIYWKASGSLRVAFFASAMTHPIVWFVFPMLMDHGVEYWPMVLLAETFAVLGEASWLRFNGVPRPLLWSFVANSCSVGCGFALRELIGFP